MHGVNDPFVSEQDQYEILELVENSELHQIVGGKHNIHLTFTEEFNRVMAEFLLRK